MQCLVFTRWALRYGGKSGVQGFTSVRIFGPMTNNDVRDGYSQINVDPSPNDSADTRLQRIILLMLTAFSGIAGVVWGLILLAFGESAGLYPIGYAILSIPTLVMWKTTKYLVYLIWYQLILITATPFLFALALGGYVGSGAMVLWSVLGPFSALLFLSNRQAISFLVVYFGLLITIAVAYPTVAVGNELADWVVLAFFVLNIGAASAVVFGLLRYFVRENRRIHELLQIEQDKSETLLANVLPSKVAQMLKNSGQTIAEQYDSVSILFADVVGFTPLAESLAPKEVVEMLNTMFTRFDELVSDCRAEKIGTIGDSYMVVAGPPDRDSDHAAILARLALKMMMAVGSAASPTGPNLTFRMGINTGPVVAGVIGTTRLHYDVWGDAVNLASRLESHGLPGKIQISQATHDAVHHRFHCAPRGAIHIKGKGEIDTWFLEGPR
jgi:adenylate cyclase